MAVLALKILLAELVCREEEKCCGESIAGEIEKWWVSRILCADLLNGWFEKSQDRKAS